MDRNKIGDNECYLSALATLLNMPLITVRHKAEEIIQGPYSSLFLQPNHTTFRKMLLGLHQTFNIEFSLKKLPSVTLPIVITSQTLRLSKNKLQGKGILSIWTSFLPGHSVAFEDGIIYDCLEQASLPYKEWKKLQGRITDFRIERLADKTDESIKP